MKNYSLPEETFYESDILFTKKLNISSGFNMQII